MIKRITACAAAALASTVLGSPATAATAQTPDRVDRVAAALAKDHLFVDPDLGFVMDTAQRANVEAALQTAERRLTVPIYVVAIPHPSAGDPNQDRKFFLFTLHDRMKREGVYVLVDDDGVLTDLPFQVPRDIQSVDFGDEESIAQPANVDNPFPDVPDRLVRLMSSLAATPSAAPTTPFRDTSPPRPPLRPGKPDVFGHFTLGLLVLGPLAGLIFFGLGRLAVWLFGRRRGVARDITARYPNAPTKPTAKSLRPKAAEELSRLREALDAPKNEDNHGRTFALTAFDAGETLFTDLVEQPHLDDRVLDLVGVIVLARMGQHALAGRTARPDPPCRFNPLHGPGTKYKNVRLPLHYEWLERCRLCPSCAADPSVERILEVRTAEGTRPYIMVTSFWSLAFGSHASDLPSRVLEHLGVND